MTGYSETDEIPEMGIELVREGDTCVLALSGELDLTAAPRLLEEVAACCDAGARVLLLDITALEFIDSTGLRAVLDSRARCEESRCSFGIEPERERVSPQVRRLFQVTGLLKRLPFPDGGAAGD
jgi:anti-sigma B factor antagonist